LSIVISICLILFGTAIIEFLENVLNRMIKDESPVIRGIGYIALIIVAIVLLYCIISYFR